MRKSMTVTNELRGDLPGFPGDCRNFHDKKLLGALSEQTPESGRLCGYLGTGIIEGILHVTSPDVTWTGTVFARRVPVARANDDPPYTWSGGGSKPKSGCTRKLAILANASAMGVERPRQHGLRATVPQSESPKKLPMKRLNQLASMESDLVKMGGC